MRDQPHCPVILNALANDGVRFAHLPFTVDRISAKLSAQP
jgi:hypothetical protein